MDRPQDRPAQWSWGRRDLAVTALVALVSVGAGLEVRLRSAGVPVPSHLATRVAQAEAQVHAMRAAAARGTTGAPFVERSRALLDSIRATPGYGARISELRGEVDAFYRDPQGIPYLLGPDPYRWLRRARNIAERGRFGESERDGRSWNDLTGVPLGVPADGNAEALAVGVVARLTRPLGGPSLESIHYWSPVAVVCTVILVAALIGKSLAGPWAGLLSATLLALQPAVADRTAAGYADTDAWNLLFALATMWLLGQSLAARERRRAVVTGILAALVVGIFAWSWLGWWFVFASFVAGLAGAILLALAASRTSGARVHDSAPNLTIGARRLANRSLLFLATALASVALLAGVPRLAGLWHEPLAALRMHASTIGDGWPNVYASVLELHPVSFDEILRGLGGDVVVALAMAGFCRLLTGPMREWILGILSIVGYAIVGIGARLETGGGLACLVVGVGAAVLGGIVVAVRRGRTVEVLPLCLAAWGFAALVACSRGGRFVLMLAPPFAIAAGTVLGELAARSIALVRSARVMVLRVGAALVPAVALVLLLRSVSGQTLRSLTGIAHLPDMNDAWAESFDWLRTNSQPNAIVCAWWDYGDMVTALGRRRVLNDAGSQTSSIAYWLGRALATDDPGESRAILRLLCLGGQESFEGLRQAGIPAQRAVEMLVELARLPSANLVAHLRGAGVPVGAAGAIAAPFLAEPPETYLWLTEELTGKASLWASCAHWDFSRGTSRDPDVEFEPAVTCAETPTGIVTENGARLELPAPGWTGVLISRSTGAATALVRRRGILRAVRLPAQVAHSLYVRLMYASPHADGPFELAWEGEAFLGERVTVYRVHW